MKAIIDCNSFYCSCERVFMPALGGRPVVVLSNNDSCVIARNDEAKKLGVDMSGPFFQIRELAERNNVAVFSSNYNLYGDMSHRVMEVLQEVLGKEAIEVYSVDESFADVSHFTLPQLQGLAADLRDKVERWTGVQVSVGIAPSKVLCKVANRLAKRNKLLTNCVLTLETPEKIQEALQDFPVGDLWGIGRQYAEKLNALGIHTAWELRGMPEEWARKHLGGVVGVRMIKELHGVPCIGLKDELVEKKMIATARMFGGAVTELKDIQEALATYVSRAAEKLRRQRSAASVVSVQIVVQDKANGPRFSHGFTVSDFRVLAQPTCVTPELLKPVMEMAERLYLPGRKYKKAGILLSGLVPDNSIQTNLFKPGQSIGRFLMEQIDNINFSMRNDVVKWAASGTDRDWKMQQNFHSPRYTTRWDELYEV